MQSNIHLDVILRNMYNANNNKRALKVVTQCLNSVIFISKSIIYLDAYIISLENYNVIEQFVFQLKNE